MVSKKDIPDIIQLVKQDTVIDKDIAEDILTEDDKVLEVSINPITEDTEPTMNLFKLESDDNVGYVTKFDNPDDVKYTLWNVNDDVSIQEFYEEFAYDPVATIFYKDDDLDEDDIDKIDDIINIKVNKCGIDKKMDKMKDRTEGLLDKMSEDKGYH